MTRLLEYGAILYCLHRPLLLFLVFCLCMQLFYLQIVLRKVFFSYVNSSLIRSNKCLSEFGIMQVNLTPQGIYHSCKKCDRMNNPLNLQNCKDKPKTLKSMLSKCALSWVLPYFKGAVFLYVFFLFTHIIMIINVGCLIITPLFFFRVGQHSNSKFLEPNSKLFLESVWIRYHALWTRSEHEFFGNTKSKLG